MTKYISLTAFSIVLLTSCSSDISPHNEHQVRQPDKIYCTESPNTIKVSPLLDSFAVNKFQEKLDSSCEVVHINTIPIKNGINIEPYYTVIYKYKPR